MSIRNRVLLTMVALSAIGVSVSSWLAEKNGEANLQEAVQRQLAGLRRSRGYEVESYFRVLRNHVDSLSEDRMFIEGMRQFETAYHELDSIPCPEQKKQRVARYYQNVYLRDVQNLIGLREKPADYLPVGNAACWLQNRYVVPPSGAPGPTEWAANDYIRAYAKYDASFRKLIDQFGYDNLLFVELHDSRIVYSVSKNPGLGTSLRSGPYRDTPLARIVAAAETTSDPEAVFVADFARYEPIYGAPAAFISSPIFDGPTRVGVFVMRISSAEIDRAVSGNHGWEKDGLGKTGDVEIVGPNHFLRSTSREFIEHPQKVLEDLQAHGAPAKEIRALRMYGTTILETKVDLGAVNKALRGEEGTLIERDSSGRRLIVSFMPLKLPGLNWVVLAHMNLDQARTPVYKYRRAAILWGLVAVLITIATALMMTEQLSRPIRSLVSAAQRMSAGDLTARVDAHSRDELGMLSSTFNRMAESVQQSMKVIENKNRENEKLLLNILPGPIAQRLKSGETTIADSYSQVTVLFADIVGFTNLSSGRDPMEIVSLLNGLFTQFDAAAIRHGIEKVKTIGDAYMAVAGMSPGHPDHAKRMVETALDMLDAVNSYSLKLGVRLAVRIGVNSGPVAAGVVGTTKFIYDLWGDTVNMASRMESTGVPGVIQVTRSVYESLKDEYRFEPRGAIEIKGKGACETWLLGPRAVEASVGSDALERISG